MDLMRFTPTPYDPMEWMAKPFTERARLACQAWATQGYAAPAGVYLVYIFKVAFYVATFLLICYLTPGCHSILDPIAFQKAILWSMMFEGLGLGCGSGPLAGRYVPPVGGFLYFARLGTTKLPLFPGVPVIGNITRSWLDVVVYVGAQLSILRALCAPGPDSIAPELLWAIVGLIALAGVLDKTLFLIFRSEHYWVTTTIFALTPDWILGAKWVQIALWTWAGVSKLNHHFPAVCCVMLSNSAVMRSETIRKMLYKNYPDDLRPSRFATIAAHMGISLEFGVPLVMLFSGSPEMIGLGIVLMLALHVFITAHVPMGVPIEWNFMVVYGVFALFYAHPEVSPFSIVDHPGLAALLLTTCFIIPLLGNLFPRAISFLLSMRYYAGNWPYSVWLFRYDAQPKIDRVVKNSETVDKQLMKFYTMEQAIAVGGRALAFRLMHLQGRALPELLPRAVDNLDNYAYSEGELVASVVLGWNFGDGHLHQEQLLAAVQQQCGFEEGELRCIFVESQPLFQGTLGYRIYDAKTGQLEAGKLEVSDLLKRQPWATRQTISVPPEPALETLGTASS
jgi:hypothetical protein